MSEHHPPRGNWAPAKPPPAFNAPAAVVVVIAVLVAVHVGLWLLGEDWEVWSLYALSLIPARFTVPGYPMLPDRNTGRSSPTCCSTATGCICCSTACGC